MPFSPLRKKFLGEILLNASLISREQLRQALEEQQKTQEKLGSVLLKHNFITESDLLSALSTYYGIPLVNFSETKIDDDALKLVPEKIARRFTVMPVVKKDNALKIAMADPSNVAAIDEIEANTNTKISLLLASEKQINEAIEKYYAAAGFLDAPHSEGEGAIEEITTDEGGELSGDDAAAAEAAPVIKYVNALLYEAVMKRASDIHIEPLEKGVSLRMRLDGELRESTPPPLKFFSAIISRIKIIAGLDIAERRLPQDGKCKMKVGDKKIDVRVSTLPTIYGEKVVMRILDRSSVSLQLKDMGLSEMDTRKFQEALESPFGMILVTGPTGSGKTTTLYTGLNYINTPDRNIVTVEDPVEYELRSVNQVQVKSAIGLTFANVLRSVLRQDPDVIMVGEIRDKETAEIAIQSALTGHLVLSTLHTNDAVSSLSRLRYMGIEAFLIADSVNLVMAQRLVRRICPSCKEEQDVPATLLTRLHLSKENMVKCYHGKGCDKCFGTGYKGRTAITEILSLSPQVRKLIMTEADDMSIKDQAIREGMVTLREMAIEKLRAGITTIEEVLTVTSAS